MRKLLGVVALLVVGCGQPTTTVPRATMEMATIQVQQKTRTLYLQRLHVQGKQGLIDEFVRVETKLITLQKLTDDEVAYFAKEKDYASQAAIDYFHMLYSKHPHVRNSH